MSCKYFTRFLFMFTLNLQLPKLKHSRILIWKALGKYGYLISGVSNVRKCKQPSPRPSCRCLPTTQNSRVDPTHNAWVGHRPLAFRSACVRCECLNLEWPHSYSFEECTYVYPNEHFFFFRYLVLLEVFRGQADPERRIFSHKGPFSLQSPTAHQPAVAIAWQRLQDTAYRHMRYHRHMRWHKQVGPVRLLTNIFRLWVHSAVLILSCHGYADLSCLSWPNYWRDKRWLVSGPDTQHALRRQWQKSFYGPFSQ